MNTKEIESKIRKLPKHLIPEIEDYIDFLLDRYTDTKINKKKFLFDWEGGLADLKEKFSSVELQHKVTEWR